MPTPPSGGLPEASRSAGGVFTVIKIVGDKVIKTEDKNFTLEETKQLFD